jgi:hypothetical protein
VEGVFPWHYIRLVAAVPFKETTTFVKTVKEGPTAQERAVRIGLMAVGLPIGFGSTKEVKKTVQETELFYYMDFFVETTGGLLRFHVDGQHLDYAAALGEQRKHDSLGNFRMLLKEVTDRSSRALISHGAKGFVVPGLPLTSLGYEAPPDYEKDLRRLTALLTP